MKTEVEKIEVQEQPRKISFRDIEDEIQTILDSFGDVEVGDIHDEHEELSDDQQVAIDEYLQELGTKESEKVDAFGCYLRMLDKKISAVRDEAQKLSAHARSLENTRRYLLGSYLGIMEQHGIKKVAGEVYTMSRRSTKVVVVDDEKAIPETWIDTKVVKTPAKRDILAALKRGEDVPGCRMGESISLVVR